MEKILVAVDIALGLIKSGSEIFTLLKGKTTLTDDELRAIVAKQDASQIIARKKLNDLLGI